MRLLRPAVLRRCGTGSLRPAGAIVGCFVRVDGSVSEYCRAPEQAANQQKPKRSVDAPRGAARELMLHEIRQTSALDVVDGARSRHRGAIA
jgi:hypothetical protein